MTWHLVQRLRGDGSHMNFCVALLWSWKALLHTLNSKIRWAITSQVPLSLHPEGHISTSKSRRHVREETRAKYSRGVPTNSKSRSPLCTAVLGSSQGWGHSRLCMHMLTPQHLSPHILICGRKRRFLLETSIPMLSLTCHMICFFKCINWRIFCWQPSGDGCVTWLQLWYS